MRQRKRIGEILTRTSLIKGPELEKILSEQDKKGELLGRMLIEKRMLSEEELVHALGLQWDIPYQAELQIDGINSGLISKIPIQFAKRHKMVPIQVKGETLVVATADPFNYQPLDDLRILSGLRIKAVLSTEAEILRAINRIYEDEASEKVEDIIEDLGRLDDRLLPPLEETEDLLDSSTEAPVIRLVNMILAQAIRSRASDIHIEPYQNELIVRYRIDGVLHNSFTPPKRLHQAIVSRVKVMAKMDIAEKRLPQDGRIRIKSADRDFDIRVSTLPTAFGERVVMRLLDKSSLLLGLDEIGLSTGHLLLIEKLIRLSHGIILVTGPTGSGKTTTLYAMLSRINSPDKNIITIEDPIEYQLNGIGQIQVNPKIDLTFAKGLRSIVRQDPDVILVGEIRDLETAEISIHAALTGHLVFSTLHTNDAAGAITRLIDMGIEPYLVSSSLNAVIAQRLVRIICPKCKEAFVPDPESLDEIGLTEQRMPIKTIYRGRGCPECFNTGYKGRTGAFEILTMDDDIRTLVLKTSESNIIKRAAMKKGMKSLRQDGAEKVLLGQTTIEEVLRVTQE